VARIEDVTFGVESKNALCAILHAWLEDPNGENYDDRLLKKLAMHASGGV
jgi:hypothetical protein